MRAILLGLALASWVLAYYRGIWEGWPMLFTGAVFGYLIAQLDEKKPPAT